MAETSITIDDVSFVVDTGRSKEMTHDVERSILRLQEGFVSKAAAQQRRGRAGRVRWAVYTADGKIRGQTVDIDLMKIMYLLQIYFIQLC